MGEESQRIKVVRRYWESNTCRGIESHFIDFTSRFSSFGPAWSVFRAYSRHKTRHVRPCGASFKH